jgi:hypothetical protein
MIKKVFAGLLYVVGAYIALVVVWTILVTIGGAFGFETAKGKYEREQLFAFYDGHRQLFCKKAGISPLSARCAQEFSKSDYKKSLSAELARVNSAKDKEVARITPLWRRMIGKLIAPFQ